MPYLIPVQYHKRKYPAGITPGTEEVAGHFDIEKTRHTFQQYSLHTEYSYTDRRLSNDTIKAFPEICRSNYNNIPCLWRSKEWALEFADFIKKITAHTRPPAIIEIHPPFSDYSGIDTFFNIYSYFEERILKFFPDVKIFIENRSGTRYRNGDFIISTVSQVMDFCDTLNNNSSNLRIVLDIPQLFTAHNITKSNQSSIIKILSQVKDVCKMIAGIHLWGKAQSESSQRISHCGDLSSYFFHDNGVKQSFLQILSTVFDDNTPRYFVPEVNSSDVDLASIVSDLLSAGFEFK